MYQKSECFVFTENDFPHFFERWVEENNLNKRSMTVTTYAPKAVIFDSYDAWKTANRDDYYKEKSYSKSCYMDEFYETAEAYFEQALAGNEYESRDAAFLEFSEDMFRTLEDWENDYTENYER